MYLMYQSKTSNKQNQHKTFTANIRIMEGLIVVFFTLQLVLQKTGSLPTTSDKGPGPVPSYDDRSDIFLNDMRFEDSDSGELGRSGILESRSRWEGAVIPYSISAAFDRDEHQIILKGMKLISSKTCITFKVRSLESNYVDIRRGAPNSGCFSFVGRTKGGQVLNLEGPDYCVKPGIVAHELIHAIGFYHEQQRPDRGNFIRVNYQNIRSEARFNFQALSSALTFGVPYDINSIMHYHSSAASKNGEPTMVLKDGRPVDMGQENRLTRYDIEKIMKMYEC